MGVEVQMTISAKNASTLELSDYNGTSHKYETFYNVNGDLVPKAAAVQSAGWEISAIGFNTSATGFDWNVVNSLIGNYYRISVEGDGLVKLLSDAITYGTVYDSTLDVAEASFVVKVEADSTQSKLTIVNDGADGTGDEPENCTTDTTNQKVTGYYRFQNGLSTHADSQVDADETATHTSADKIKAKTIVAASVSE